MKEEKLKHGERRAKDEAIALKRLKKFTNMWYPTVDKNTPWMDPDKNLALIKGKFKKWNGTCNSEMCRHPRHNREQQRKENRKIIEE